MIQTLDFFTPIVDDPYMFGQIAAANALSDVYAMGGKPLIALNIVGFPKKLDPQILADILKGGADKVIEAGALLVGGHSVDDSEPKYGLSVSGIVHPDKVLTNSGAKVGDVVVLTKPVGSGILNTALKADFASEESIQETIEVMATLNKITAELAIKYRVSAMTDITGFGVIGHLSEVTRNSQVSMIIDHSQIPLIKGVKNCAKMGYIPGGNKKNQEYYSTMVEYTESMDPVYLPLLNDPQTSGGLAIIMPREDAEKYLEEVKVSYRWPCALIGEVIEKGDKEIYVK
jgi:selenide,water dikinase